MPSPIKNELEIGARIAWFLSGDRGGYSLVMPREVYARGGEISQRGSTTMVPFGAPFV